MPKHEPDVSRAARALGSKGGRAGRGPSQRRGSGRLKEAIPALGPLGLPIGSLKPGALVRNLAHDSERKDAFHPGRWTFEVSGDDGLTWRSVSCEREPSTDWSEHYRAIRAKRKTHVPAPGLVGRRGQTLCGEFRTFPANIEELLRSARGTSAEALFCRICLAQLVKRPAADRRG